MTVVQSSPPACGTYTSLTEADRAVIARAREALDAPHGYGPLELAEQIGRLEWHLAELIRLAEGTR
jgi:hypothetical protein